jgi:cell division protease FtsH
VNPTRNRSSIIYLLLFVAIIVMVVYQFQQQSNTEEPLTINELAADVQAGNVAKIVEDDNRLRITMANGDIKESQKETDATLIQQLKELGVSTAALSSDNVKIEVQPPSAWLGIATALGYFIPFILLAGVFWFVFRQAQGSNNAAMSFGKSKARMFSGDHPAVTFEDVAGVEEAKEELAEVVEFLRCRCQPSTRLIRTGKTTLALHRLRG